ncbi:class I SAM-dependent methyltransferase [Actinophytocola sp.]|uniref:class I SAM-dependent methyltransferase n=1 Tax=Actinophytocola sp. TaxID=1872138 RepID=UPI002ED426A4
MRRGADTLPSPNIWNWPETYEVENRAQDVDGEIWRVLAEVADWTGRDVLDIGCGTGFHLPRFAASARHVTGVEPYAPLVPLAQERVARLPNVDVKLGSAQRLPMPDASVDMAHARTAYFFGPGCEPGIAEVERVLRPGGVLVIVDLDARHRPYGDWMRADLPRYDPFEVDRFFTRMGFDCRTVETRWRFADRQSLESVLRIEFSPRVADRATRDVPGLEFPVGYRVLTRRKPTGLVF